MKIRSETYLRLALLFPYTTGILLIPVLLLASVTDGDPVFFVLEIFIVFMAGVSLWLIPYTVLVILLWLWSRKKSEKQIVNMFIWSPFYLAILTFVYSMIVTYFVDKPDNELHFVGVVPIALVLPLNVCAVPAALIIGYIFVSFAFIVYGILHSLGIVAAKRLNPSRMVE